MVPGWRWWQRSAKWEVAERRMLRRIRLTVRSFPVLTNLRCYLNIPRFQYSIPKLTHPSLLLSTPSTSRVTFSTAAMSGFYSLKAETPEGKTYDFADLKGKVVLIVNVASKWYVARLPILDPLHWRCATSGFTPHYKGRLRYVVHLFNSY